MNEQQVNKKYAFDTNTTGSGSVNNAQKTAADYLSVFSGNDGSVSSDGSPSIFTDKNGKKVTIDPKVEKESRAKAEQKKREAKAGQIEGNDATVQANDKNEQIQETRAQQSEMTKSSNASNQQAMNGIRQNTTQITTLNGQIAKNQLETMKLEQEQAQLVIEKAGLQQELDAIMGTSSGSSAATPAASNPRASANPAKAGNAAGAAGAQAPQGQVSNGNGADQTQDPSADISQTRFLASTCGLQTAAGAEEARNQGKLSDADRNIQAAGGKPQAQGHKAGNNQPKTASAHCNNADKGSDKGSSNKSALDKLSPEQRAKAEQLMAQIAGKDQQINGKQQQIQNKQQQRDILVKNKDNAHKTAQTTNSNQVKVGNKANDNANSALNSAVQVLDIAQNLNNIAKKVQMIGKAVQAAGEALKAIPYIGPIIGPPVVMAGQITEKIGNIAYKATELLSKVAGAIKAAITGDIKSLGQAAASLAGTMSQETAAYNSGGADAATGAAQGAAKDGADATGNALGDAASNVGEGLQKVGDAVGNDTAFGKVLNGMGDVAEKVGQNMNEVGSNVSQALNTAGNNFLTNNGLNGFAQAVNTGVGAAKAVTGVAQNVNSLSRQIANNASKSSGTSFGQDQDSNKTPQDWAKDILGQNDPTKINQVPENMRTEVAQLVDKERPGFLKQNHNGNTTSTTQTRFASSSNSPFNPFTGRA